MPKRSTPLAALVATSRALGHPTRLRMVAILDQGERCGCQLMRVLELAPSTISEHLRVLVRAGLARERRDGKMVFYSLHRDSRSIDIGALLVALGQDPVVARDRELFDRISDELNVAAGRQTRSISHNPDPDPYCHPEQAPPGQGAA